MNEFFDKIVELFTTPEYIDSLLHGFLLTLQISFFAILIGLLIGTIVALIDNSLSIHDLRIVHHHKNTLLVFDILKPFECSLSEDDIKEKINKYFRKEKNILVKINFDTNYVR